MPFDNYYLQRNDIMKNSELINYLYLETATILEQCSFPDNVKRIYKNSNPILHKLLGVFGDLYSRVTNLKYKKKNDKIKIMFQRTKYMDIINELTRINDIEVLIWSESIRDVILPKYKFNKVYIPSIRCYTINYIKNLDNKVLNSLINKLIKDIEKIKKILLRYSPDLIILRTDSFPTDRAVILAAKELDIPTINIQDGIYQSQLPLIHGRAADYVFVWGKYFKNLYLKQKIRSDKTIKILGYPYELKPLPQKHKKQNLTVYYLGQNYEMYNIKLLETKIKTVNTLNEICKKLNFEFIYRPHPGDLIKVLQKRLPNVKFAPKNETLYESFKRGDIFISFSSTSLVEVGLHGKIGIQLKNYPLPVDDFEKLGICSKSFDTLEELEDYLKEIAKADTLDQFYKPVNPEYIEIPKPSPGMKFLELIEDII